MVRNEDLRGKNQVFESELTVIKKEILKERRAQNDLQKLCQDKDAVIHDLKGKLIDQELECGDRDQKIQRLTNQKLILEKKLDESETNLQERDQQVYMLKEQNKNLSS